MQVQKQAASKLREVLAVDGAAGQAAQPVRASTSRQSSYYDEIEERDGTELKQRVH